MNLELEKSEEIVDQGYKTANEILDNLLQEKGNVWKELK